MSCFYFSIKRIQFRGAQFALNFSDATRSYSSRFASNKLAAATKRNKNIYIDKHKINDTDKDFEPSAR